MTRSALVLLAILASLPAAADDVLPPGNTWCQVTRPENAARDTILSLSQATRRRAIGDRRVDIDLMEVYGPVLLREAGSAAAAEALIQYQVDVTNQALSDSGLNHVRLRLRHALFSQKYDRFPIEGDPAKELEAERQYYGADLIGFAVGQTPIGIAGAACRPPSYDPGCGVSWVHEGNFASYPLAFAHEIGHNLGADHDAPNAMRSSDPHPFARAYCMPGVWRTLMSYDTPCHARAILQYSNPRRAFGGLATGIEDQADNVRAISIVAPLVRDYYPAAENIGPRCEVRITFDAADVPASGTARTAIAERTRGDCAPEISSLDDWIRVEASPTSTPERTEATVTFLSNDGAPRRGHFVVGEQPVTIEQATAAACALPNESFDQNLNGWTLRLYGSSVGSASWSPLNAIPGQSSGSAAVTSRGQAGLERCVPIEAAAEYLLRARIYIPPGQRKGPDDFAAYVTATVFTTPDCSGPDPGGGGEIFPNISGSWFPIDMRVITNNPGHEGRSVRIGLNVFVNTGEPFTTYFDDVSLCKLKM